LDANGSTTSDAVNTFVYDTRGRMAQSTNSASLVTTYQVNALGQRIRKTNSNEDTVFIYDTWGKLIAENDASGTLKREFIYLGDVPVGGVQGGALAFIHPDHLNTPRQVFDDQQQLRWKWDQAEPFGVTTPDENPVNLGAFEMPLRFPGQYADKETNLGYNYFRNYDPTIGRFGESDPLGLLGGLNTYAYVDNNALSFIDPSGLEAVRCRRGNGSEPGGQLYGIVTQHSYSCVRVNAQWVCGGQSTEGSIFRSLGAQSRRDYYVESACKAIVDSNSCFEECLHEEWDKPRPTYSIVPFVGTQCHQYDNDVNRRCRLKCGMK
jgi:RHS repeat-associated protein